MSELVEKLASGNHRVIFRPIGDNPVEELKQSLDRDYVHIKFTETRGGTELGFRPDPDRSRTEDADFAGGQGPVHLEGELTLDYVKVRLVADLALETMEGTGHLEVLD